MPSTDSAELEQLRAALATAQAENAALAAKHDLFQKAARDAFWDWDLATQHVGWNAALQALFGWTPAQVEPTAQWWIDRIHPEDRDRVVRSIHDAQDARRTVWQDVYRFERADGEHVWVEDRGYCVFGPDGAPTRMVGAIADIQAQTEEAAAARRFSEALLAKLPAGVSYVDDQLVFRLANEAYGRFAGVPAEALPGRPYFEIFPEAREAVAPLFEQVRATREPFVGQAFPVPIHGKTTYWDFTMAPMTAPDGTFTGYLTLALEVTPRVELERKLADQSELTKQLFNHTPAGMSYLDRDLVYRITNPFQLRFMGRTADQVVDKSLVEVWGPEADAQVGDLLRGVLATGEPYSATGLAFDQVFDGVPSKSYWDFTYAPVFAPDGSVQGVLVLTQEVTDRIKTERLAEEKLQALQEADRMKDEFLSVISHELRTPLNFIMGFASILEDEVPGPLNDGQQQSVGRILAGADRMLGIVDDLLDFARLQAGRLRLIKEPADLAAVIGEVAAGARPAAEARGLDLLAEVAPLPPASLDAARMVQVLNNLVGNAIKFTPAGGRVTIAARAEGGQLLCEVADTGVGIEAADLGRLFQRFQQLDMGATREAGGTGLGLAISRAIVEGHGGTIGVRSPGPGRGSTFWVRLPLDA